MKGQSVNYLGKVVLKDHFRAFIYGADGKKKLIQTWDAFENHMGSGLWFATKPKTQTHIKYNNETSKKINPKKTKKTELKRVDERQEVRICNDLAFEVTAEKDDLLS